MRRLDGIVSARTVLVILFCGAALRDSASAAEPTRTTMEARIYPSSIDPDLKLSAEFHVPEEPKPLCLFFHGWHMTAAGSTRGGYMKTLGRDYFVVNVDMRGRAKSTGKPDASGHELIDGLDALDYARRTWPQAVDSKPGVYLVGGSGGGGNTMSLMGKAPDIFTAAAAWAGMSDYALWYRDDKRGAYRDEMEAKGWIGGNPESNPEGYESRGGIYLLENVLADLLVIHGRKDGAVRVHHATTYEERAKVLGKTNVRVHLNDRGHGSAEWPMMMEFLRTRRTPPKLPQNGSLLVHSFLATRAFWLVLDDPARMGKVDYELDVQGQLTSLRFAQAEGRTPVKAVLLRTPGAAHDVSVEMNGRTFSPKAERSAEGHADFRWACEGEWTLKIAR